MLTTEQIVQFEQSVTKRVNALQSYAGFVYMAGGDQSLLKIYLSRFCESPIEFDDIKDMFIRHTDNTLVIHATKASESVMIYVKFISNSEGCKVTVV